MKKVEVRQLLDNIAALYPNYTVTENRLKLWYDFLEDIVFKQAMINLRLHARDPIRGKYIPTIADVRGVKPENKAIVSNYCEVTGRMYEIYESPELN